MTTLLEAGGPPASYASVRAGMRRLQTGSGAGLGIGAIIAVWAILAAREPELIMPSPAETVAAIGDLAADGVLGSALATTLGRAVIGVALALAIGALWGALNGVSRWALSISQPALAVSLSVPPIVLAVLGLTWFGPGAATTRLVIIVVATPLIVIAVQEAVRNIDTDLLEMGAAFGLSRWLSARHIVIPAITSPVLAAASVTVGQALRVAVMAELLSATDGIGATIARARARANLETADVFAWTLVLIAVVLVIELAVLRPFTNRLLRWRVTTT